jgi:thioredoxin-related protein
MNRLIVLILVLAPVFTFSQGAQKLEIDWITLEKAKKYAKKYDKNILIYFYKKDCPYCDEMNNETLIDLTIVDLINNNFFPVKIDSRTKDTITYNGIKYSNQQPISDGSLWPHDFYREVAKMKNGQTTTPTIVLFNTKFEKITIFPGKQAKPLLLRRIKPYVK